MQDDDGNPIPCEECGNDSAFEEQIRGQWLPFCSDECAKKNRPAN